jgi:serine/threonine-protein kinase
MCPKCGGEVRDGWRVCPACAGPLDPATQTIFQQSSSSSSGLEEGRFPAGTILAGRYRILGLLGQGGMGEVYRAYDLILNQAVALKFLPQAQMSEPALARFRNEVRIARQVSHPNVCRVYDIGFVEGLHFISMEYLDGEDLGSLLRRIGRLPQDKAIEFTRKICAGLSAAHERGVLHRDLKPSNIMIDGRGHVRITDFGLAALAQEIALGDIRSGTPAYMSPEQKAGKEVTTRSDIYSLGLVLHEMFTGKRRGDSQSSPSEIVKDLDPAVERLILRCIEEDPKRRPQSALNVAMALPGADPIAAALAAGETPSPEMVAASQEKEGFTPRTAILCFAATLVFLAAGTFLATKTTLLNRVRLDIPPEVLAFRAQELLKQFGYGDAPVSTAYGFELADQNGLYNLLNSDPVRWTPIIDSQQPPPVRFWYRQHQDRFYVDSFFNGQNGVVDYSSPANSEPGMIRLALDTKGRLNALEVRSQDSAVPLTKQPDWNALLTAAGLDPTRFTATEPKKVPPVASDARAAWIGTYAESRPEQIRVEAASWGGRPVFLSVAGSADAQQTPLPTWVAILLVVFSVGPLVGAMVLAWYNLRQGRGDRGGAAKIAWAAFSVSVIAWALTANHVAVAWEGHLVLAAIAEFGIVAGLMYVVYLAIEPYARRHWPDSLISWTRAQSGRLRDPLVASHILVGITAMIVWERFAQRALALSTPLSPEIPWPLTFWNLDSGAYPLVRFCMSFVNGLVVGFLS